MGAHTNEQTKSRNDTTYEDWLRSDSIVSPITKSNHRYQKVVGKRKPIIIKKLY